MRKSPLPLSKTFIDRYKDKIPTPYYLYAERGLRTNAAEFMSAFSVFPKFKQFFAVKALPTTGILEILKSEGMGMDCSSLAELHLAEKAGVSGDDIILSSNQTPLVEYQKAVEMGAIINLDDIEHIDILNNNGLLTDTISFRYNPGDKIGNLTSPNVKIIGSPIQSKFGLTHEQMYRAYQRAKDLGVKRFGIHTMLASNELKKQFFVDNAKSFFSLVKDLESTLDIQIDFINLGGGIGIPYRPFEKPISFRELASELHSVYNDHFTDHKPQFCMEQGRCITGPYGFLVTKVLYHKVSYKNYLGLDACMADLMRPALYGAYHHITVIGKDDHQLDHTYDVVGSLCENNDKFAIDRSLPKVSAGDYLVFHDAGAHARAIGFNYNGKLRPAEYLYNTSEDLKMLRRAETLEDYFATLDF